jgi:hypothetical protein
MQIKPLDALPSQAMSTPGPDGPLTAAAAIQMVENWSDLLP